MANSRSARKRIRANQRRHLRNRAVRSAVRTKIGKARRALLGEEEQTPETQLSVAISALDRAADKGILHPKNAARRKSRLMVLANRLGAAAGADEEAQSAARAAAVGGEKGRRATRGATAKPAQKGARNPATARPPAKAAATTQRKPASGSATARGSAAARGGDAAKAASGEAAGATPGSPRRRKA